MSANQYSEMPPELAGNGSGQRIVRRAFLSLGHAIDARTAQTSVDRTVINVWREVRGSRIGKAQLLLQSGDFSRSTAPTY